MGREIAADWGQGPYRFSGRVEIIGRASHGQIEVRIVEVIQSGSWCPHQRGDVITVDMRHLGFR